MKTDRRGFLKRVGVVVGVTAVPTIAARKKVQKVDRSVVWGTNTCRGGTLHKGYVMLQVMKFRWADYYVSCSEVFGDSEVYSYGVVLVDCISDIEPGQEIIWHPNGTISGGLK